MKKNVLLNLAVLILFVCCSTDDEKPLKKDSSSTKNKVLLLKVDYLTNAFEGGIELNYPTNTTTFTITNEYISPGDFGNIKLKYQELNEILFDGDIIWMGKGEIKEPKNISPANQFIKVKTTEIVNPAAGFQNVFNPNNEVYDYAPIWLSVQRLALVREYLNSNPNATVKLFLYTPSVGIGDPADWDWIFFLKK